MIIASIFSQSKLINLTIHKYCNFPCAGDVRFSLRGTIYQNNSCVALEDIGENDSALLCKTNFAACCLPPYTGENGPLLGKWFFPNGTAVPGNGSQLNLYRTRGEMVVRLNHKRGGEEGIYRCEIPDSMNVTQNIYIGVYTVGEWLQFKYSHTCSTYVAKSDKYNMKVCTTHCIMGNCEIKISRLFRQTNTQDMQY